MKFIVSRTSGLLSDDKPIEEAFLYPHEQWHTRTLTEEEFDKKFGGQEGLWRSKGTEHKTENEGQWIARREADKELWTVEIESLHELMHLSKKYGDIIIREKDYNSTSPKIEIYDDYRE